MSHLDAPNRPAPQRKTLRSLLRGFVKRCPRCGEGHLFKSYLGIVGHCPVCGERLGHIKADDGPAYFTILIVGHIVVPMALWSEQTWHPEVWLSLTIALPATIALTFALLPAIKGAVLGVMWSHRLTGQESPGDEHFDDGVSP